MLIDVPGDVVTCELAYMINTLVMLTLCWLTPQSLTLFGTEVCRNSRSKLVLMLNAEVK